MNELASIIMPSYNTAQYIYETIQSVLAQTYTNWELIIVDDCSTDNTDEVVKSFLSDDRIKYKKTKLTAGQRHPETVHCVRQKVNGSLFWTVMICGFRKSWKSRSHS